MIRKIETTDYARLQEIWENSVYFTHDFLKEEDFNYYKKQLPIYFEQVSLVGFENEGILVGFIGIAKDNLEMLFIHNDYRGKGIGKRSLNHAINHYQIRKVDVNEQNSQALEFYKHLGFHVISRSEVDGAGKDYPILHMVL